MSDEEANTGVQLAKRVSNKNPLVSEEVPALTSPPSPPPPRKGGREDDDDDDDDLKPPASKEAAPSSLKSSLSEGGGDDIIEDNTDIDEEDLPDSEPVSTSMTVVESSTTGAPSASNNEHITECATAWSVVGFALTTAHTGIYAAFALTKDDVY